MKFGKKTDARMFNEMSPGEWYHVFWRGQYRGIMICGALYTYLQGCSDHVKDDIGLYEAEDPEVPEKPIQFEEGCRYSFKMPGDKVYEVKLWYFEGKFWREKVVTKMWYRSTQKTEEYTKFSCMDDMDDMENLDHWEIEKLDD